MVSDGFTLRPLRICDRLALQMLYLRRYCRDLLDGTRPERPQIVCCELPSELLAPLAFERDILMARRPIEDLSRSRQDTFEERLRSWHAHMLDQIDNALTGRVSLRADEHMPGDRVCREAWAWGRLRARDAEPFGFGKASLLGLLHGHLLLVYQLAMQAQAKAEAEGLRRVRNDSRKHIERLAQESNPLERETGDLVSELISVCSLFYCLAAYNPRVSQTKVGSSRWPKGLEQLVIDRLVEIATHNDLICQCYPQIGQRASERQDGVRFRRTASLGEEVEEMQQAFEKFAYELVRPGGRPEVSRPLSTAVAAQHELSRFASLRSPLLSDEEASGFRGRLAEQLAACAGKLLMASVRPRPAIYEGFFEWAREHFVLPPGMRLSLSEACLHILLCCYDLLRLQQATDDRTRKTVLATVRQAEQSLQAGQFRVGDAVLAALACNGLQRAFGRLLRDDGQAPWSQVLPLLDSDVRETTLELAAASPLVRLNVPELEVELHTKNLGWRGLEEFLGDPAADAMRRDSARRLADAARKAGPDLTGSIRRNLTTILGAASTGSAIFIGEFMHHLLDGLFSQLDREGQRRHERQHVEQPDTAAAEFRKWFADLYEEGPRFMYRLLAALPARLAAESASGREVSHEVGQLRRLWREIVHAATREVSRPSLPRQSHRLVRLFFANLCVAVLEDQPSLSSLSTGFLEHDEPVSLGCQMLIPLLAEWAAWIGEEQPTDAGPGGGLDDADWHTTDDTADMAVIEQLAETAIEQERLRRGLLARQVLLDRYQLDSFLARVEPDPELRGALQTEFDKLDEQLGTQDRRYRWNPRELWRLAW